MSAILAAALEYAAHGWPVFPLRGKVPARPRTQGGRGFLDATTDLDAIAEMWRRYPQANIGLRTGAASGIAALDIDPRHGGTHTLTGIEQELGVLPGTVMQLTGNTDNGLHLLYRHQQGLGTSATWGSGLDLRGEGGYIVAAPSVHPDTGRTYRWLGGVWATLLTAWPTKQLPIPAAAPQRPTLAVIQGGPRPAAQGPLAGLVRVVLEAAEGQRNNSLNWAAHKAGEHVRAGRLTVPEVVTGLYEAAVRVGLGEREAVRTIASGLGSHAASRSA